MKINLDLEKTQTGLVSNDGHVVRVRRTAKVFLKGVRVFSISPDLPAVISMVRREQRRKRRRKLKKKKIERRVIWK